MNNAIIIGFSGKAGCGKGAASEIIKSLYYHVGIFPLAEDIKRIAKIEFNWDGNKDEKGRKLLQTLGTECGRMYGGENFWVDKWVRKVYNWIEEKTYLYEESLSIPPIVICDDVRFDSEARCIKNLGGYIIHIKGRADDIGSNASHSSESGINSIYVSYTIQNDKGLDNLKNQIELIIFKIIQNTNSNNSFLTKK